MKNGWQTKTLGEICDIERGGSPRPIQNFITTASNGINWIKIGDATASGKYIYKTEEKIKPEGVKRSRMVYEGDFILSNSMSFGRPYIMKTTGCIHDGWLVLHQPKVNPDYLYHALSSDLVFDQFDRLAAGSTVRNLNIGLAKSVEIPYPPPAEQQRIVDLLDEAFVGIATAQANAEKNLHNVRALFESHLQSVFTQRGNGWVEKPFSELCDIRHGYAFEGEFFSNEGEYVLLTPGNFYESGGYRDRGEKQKYYNGEIPRDYVLDQGDLLVAMTEQAAGLLGSPILVPESNKFLHNQRLGLVIKKPGVPWTNEFFFHVFNLQAVRRAIHASASGVKVRHTSPTKIGDVVVAFPTSLTEQKRIVSNLASLSEETQRLASIYERKLAALEELKKSLLHQAFTGELTKHSPPPVVVPLLPPLPGISTTDLHAGILAIAYLAHEQAGKSAWFGHVKAEKMSHMAEALAGIDLGRNPVMDHFGPDDFPHLQKVEHRARMAGFFDFKRKPGSDAYQITKGRNFDALVTKARTALGDLNQKVDAVIQLMLNMDMQQAEIFATTYAAWNNLLLDRRTPTDEQIVRAAREDWHADKLKIPREKFFKAIEWLRKKSLVPEGKGKRVVRRS